MSEAWQNGPLESFVTFQRGYDITKAQQSEGPYPVISSSGPGSTNAEAKIKGPGVVIGRKGTLGTVFYTPGDYWPHDTTLWVKDFHGNSPRFAYYFLRTLHLEQYDSGSSNPTLNRNHIHLLSIRYPYLGTQRKIAAILSAYDDLIENNMRRIQILEDMTRSLYREWFVQFRFPGHENTSLVESALGLIPEGWQCVTLKDICSHTGSGGTPSRQKPSSWFGDVKWFKTKEMSDSFLFSSEEHISQVGLSTSSAKLFPSGTVVMAIYAAPTVGRLGILTYDSAFNQAACGLVANSSLVSTWFLFLKLWEMRSYFNRIAQGAAQQNISVEKVRNAVLSLPSKNLITKFDKTAEGLFLQIRSLQLKNQNLRKTRDLLLPRLISGELDVSGLGVVGGVEETGE